MVESFINSSMVLALHTVEHTARRPSHREMKSLSSFIAGEREKVLLKLNTALQDQTRLIESAYPRNLRFPPAYLRCKKKLGVSTSAIRVNDRVNDLTTEIGRFVVNRKQVVCSSIPLIHLDFSLYFSTLVH
jgi:hypothetical protein